MFGYSKSELTASSTKIEYHFDVFPVRVTLSLPSSPAMVPRGSAFGQSAGALKLQAPLLPLLDDEEEELLDDAPLVLELVLDDDEEEEDVDGVDVVPVALVVPVVVESVMVDVVAVGRAPAPSPPTPPAPPKLVSSWPPWAQAVNATATNVERRMDDERTGPSYGVRPIVQSLIGDDARYALSTGSRTIE